MGRRLPAQPMCWAFCPKTKSRFIEEDILPGEIIQGWWGNAISTCLPTNTLSTLFDNVMVIILCVCGSSLGSFIGCAKIFYMKPDLKSFLNQGSQRRTFCLVRLSEGNQGIRHQLTDGLILLVVFDNVIAVLCVCGSRFLCWVWMDAKICEKRLTLE